MLESPFKDCCDLVFLALAVWREARGESEEAQLAVAFSILTRVASPGWWGRDSIQSVVFRKWQYSSLTNPHDLQLTTWPVDPKDPRWNEVLSVCDSVIYGKATNPLPGADSYFDTSIPDPSWAKDATFLGQLGKLKFYKTEHDYETGKA